MKIVIDSVEFQISWKHNNNGQGQRSSTQCIIKRSNSPLEVHIGTSTCHPKDNFNKKIGRKVSFAHAVSSFPDKNTRRRFWEAYLHLTLKVNTANPVK